MEKRKLKRHKSFRGVPFVLSLKPLFSLLTCITHFTEWTWFRENAGKSSLSGWRPSCVGPKKQSIHFCLIQPALRHQVLSPISRLLSPSFSLTGPVYYLSRPVEPIAFQLCRLQLLAESWGPGGGSGFWVLGAPSVALPQCPSGHVIHRLACIPGF